MTPILLSQILSQTRRALLVEVRRAAANDAVLFPAKLLKPSNRAKLGCFQNCRVISSDIFFSANDSRGFTGSAPSRQTVGGGLPPAMLACPEFLWFSDCRLQLILGTVFCCTCEPQTFQAWDFLFLQFQSYYTDSKLLRREFFALPFAHTCATLPCGALCSCGSGSLSTVGDGGQESAHSAGLNSGKTIP